MESADNTCLQTVGQAPHPYKSRIKITKFHLNNAKETKKQYKSEVENHEKNKLKRSRQKNQNPEQIQMDYEGELGKTDKR